MTAMAELRSHSNTESSHLNDELQFILLANDEVDEAAVVRWRDLARRSCHQNPFLMPEFLLPNWRWLAPDQEHVLAIVRHANGRWMAAAGFCLNEVTRTLPWPHIVTATSPYTFRTGILLDSDRAAEALDALLMGLTRGGWQQHAIEIPGLRLDSVLARELQAAALRLRYTWQTTIPRSVPAIFPEIISEEYLAQHWSASRRKSLRRSRAKLEHLGSVQLRYHREPDDVSLGLETFLRLEHDSWKGNEGTACLSNERDEQFIREMVEHMAQQGHILLTELRAGERIIASAINLIAGTGLFAFKIGWDKTWAAASPGMLHEAELVLAARDQLRDFTLFDSCATEESYLSTLWTERIPVATGILCSSWWSSCSHRLMQTGRDIRRILRQWKRSGC